MTLFPIEFIVTVTDGDEEVGPGPRSPAAITGALVCSYHPYVPANLVTVIFFSSLMLDDFFPAVCNTDAY